MKHDIRRLNLKNGAEGILIDVPDATVMTFDVNFRAGDFLSPKGKWEVAHVLEHMVFGANSQYDRPRDFQAVFQMNGAYMNASTGPHNLMYTSECADFEWARILDLIRLSIESPKLSDQEFKAEMGNVREELVGDLNHNFRQILIRAREKFGLVALNDGARIEQLTNIDVDDIRDYYARTHTAKNMQFIIAGNTFSREKEIVEQLEKIDLPTGMQYDLPDEVPVAYDEVFYHDRPGLENVYFLLSTFTTNSLTLREEDALNLVNTMLTATIHSRILGEARERGLAYDISSSPARLKNGAGWWFGAELTEQNALPVFEIIKRELGDILQGKLDKADVESAKKYSLGRYQRSAQTVRGLANGYAGQYFFDGRIDDYFAVPERIKQVTRQDMIEVVQKMFGDKLWGLAVMGQDKDELAKELNHEIASLWN